MALKVDAIEYPPGSGTYQDIGASTDYTGLFIDDEPYEGLSGSLIERQIPGRSGQFDGLNVAPRILPISLMLAPGAAITSAQFHANVMQWFAPAARDSSGRTTRYLRCIWHDGSTQIRIPVNVVSVRVRPRHINVFDVVLQATWPYFEATSTQSTSTNDGNADAPLVISLASVSTNVDSYKRFTIQETAGIGVNEVPVMLDSGLADLTEAQTYVYDQYGVSRPFVVVSSRYVWTTCSVGPNETVTYHVVEDTSFSGDNPLAGTLDWGTFYTSGTVNTSYSSDGFLIGSNPARNGLWVPHRLSFVGGGASDWGYEITEASTNCVFTIRNAANKARNDANGMVIVTGIPADSITGLSRVTANHTTDIRSIVRYRQAGQANWTDSNYSVTTSTTVTTTITLSDAVEITCGIEVTGSSPTDSATLTLSGTGTPDINVNFDTAKDLTVTRTISATADVRILEGNVTNTTTGQVITFSNVVYYDAVTSNPTMVLDFSHDATKRMYSSDTSNGVILAPENGISFSDPVGGMHLAPGANTVTDTTDATVTLSSRDTYA